jgi:hypothetical protein
MIVLLFFICHTPRFIINIHEFLTLEALRQVRQQLVICFFCITFKVDSIVLVKILEPISSGIRIKIGIVCVPIIVSNL